VHVVVNVLASDDGRNGVCVCGLSDNALILELRSLTGEALLDGLGVTVFEVAVLDGDQVVGVLLGQNLAVGNGLD